jgi:hypothetical protein
LSGSIANPGHCGNGWSRELNVQTILIRQLEAISDISEVVREHWKMGAVRTMHACNNEQAATDEIAQHVAGWILKNR